MCTTLRNMLSLHTWSKVLRTTIKPILDSSKKVQSLFLAFLSKILVLTEAQFLSQNLINIKVASVIPLVFN